MGKSDKKPRINLPRRISNLHSRWDISFNDDNKFHIFKNRVLSIIENCIGDWILSSPAIQDRFAFLVGMQPQHSPTGKVTEQANRIYQDAYGFRSCQVYKVFQNTRDLPHLVNYLQLLIFVLEENGYETQNNVVQRKTSKFIEELQEVTKTPPLINLTIIRRSNQTLLYPAGAKILDDAVVDDVLAWLEDFPLSLKPFEKALTLYQYDKLHQQRELLDNLRFAVEKLLQAVLGNSKALEKQQEILSQWLKNRGVHQQVINMYQQLLFGPYRIYQNEAVKHNDSSSPVEVEFMIYLTGTFMRLLIQLHRERRNE